MLFLHSVLFPRLTPNNCVILLNIRKKDITENVEVLEQNWYVSCQSQSKLYDWCNCRKKWNTREKYGYGTLKGFIQWKRNFLEDDKLFDDFLVCRNQPVNWFCLAPCSVLLRSMQKLAWVFQISKFPATERAHALPAQLVSILDKEQVNISNSKKRFCWFISSLVSCIWEESVWKELGAARFQKICYRTAGTYIFVIKVKEDDIV